MKGTRGSEIKIEVIHTLEGMKSLEVLWKDLHATIGKTTPFQSFEWCYTWCEVFIDRYKRLDIIVGYNQADLVMVLPFAIENYSERYYQANLVGGDASDKVDILVKPGFESLVEGILKDWIKAQKIASIQLRSVPEWSPLTPVIVKWKKNPTMRFINDPVWGDKPICLVLLPPTWEEYLSLHASKNHQKSIKRALQGVYQRGLTFGCSDHPTNEEILEIIELHITSRRIRDLPPSEWAEPTNRRFIEKAFRMMFDSGQAILYTIKDFNKLVAFDVEILDKEWYYGNMMGLNVDYLSIGPGSAILAYAVQQAIEHGYKGADFGAGSEEYKQRWCNASVPVTFGEFVFLGPILRPLSYWFGQARGKVKPRTWLKQAIEHFKPSTRDADSQE